MESKKHIRRLAVETAVYGLSGVISQLVNVFLFPLFAKTLSLSQYGMMTMLTSFTGLVGTFVILGLDSASARFFFDSEDRFHRRQIIGSWFWCQTCFGFALAIAIAFGSRPLAHMLLGSQQWFPLVLLVDAVVLTRSVAKVFGNWLRYQRRPWIAIGYSLLSTFLLIGLSLVFVLFGRMGLYGVYWAQLIAGMAVGLVAVFFLKDWISLHFFSSERLKAMLVYGLPLIPAALASWVTASANRFFLRHYCDFNEIGLYGAAVTVASAVTLATGAFQMAWGPFAFSILNKKESKLVYSRVLTMYIFWGVWLATGLSLFSPPLLKWLAAPQYSSASTCVPYIAFGYLAIGATFIAALGSTVVKKSTPVAVSIFIGAGINTVLNFILIPPFGKEGAAIATLAAYATAVVFLFARSQKLFPIPYRFKETTVCLCLAVVVIALDRFLLYGKGAVIQKIGLSLVFLPLGFYLKIITVEKIKNGYKDLARRLRGNR